MLDITTSDGNHQQALLTLYPGLHGSDDGLMRSGWAAVGGDGDNPCLEASPATNYRIPSENTYFVFGTLSYADLTAGFEPPDLIYQWTAHFTSDDSMAAYAYTASMGVQFSDGDRCELLAGGVFITPDWTHDEWGPVPVVVAIDGIYSPATPAGDHSAIANWTLGLSVPGAYVENAARPIVLPPPVS